MSSEEQSVQEQEGSAQVERGDERSALGPVSGRVGEKDEYAGPDPERADEPPVPEEDQGV